MAKKESKPKFERKQPSLLHQKMFTKAGVPIQKQTWSDVDDLYLTTAASLVEIGNSVNIAVQVLNNEGCTSSEVITSVNGIARDLESFADDLKTLKSRHEGKSGDIETPEDTAICFGLFSDYMTLSERLRALTFSPMLTITEYLAEIADKKAKEKENAPMDVEFKEVSCV